MGITHEENEKIIFTTRDNAGKYNCCLYYVFPWSVVICSDVLNFLKSQKNYTAFVLVYLDVLVCLWFGDLIYLWDTKDKKMLAPYVFLEQIQGVILEKH